MFGVSRHSDQPDEFDRGGSKKCTTSILHMEVVQRSLGERGFISKSSAKKRVRECARTAGQVPSAQTGPQLRQQSQNLACHSYNCSVFLTIGPTRGSVTFLDQMSRPICATKPSLMHFPCKEFFEGLQMEFELKGLRRKQVSILTDLDYR